MLPTTACAQTTPLICGVGSTSAVTVGGVAGFAGLGGALSAKAGPAAKNAPKPSAMAVVMASVLARGSRFMGRVSMLWVGEVAATMK